MGFWNNISDTLNDIHGVTKYIDPVGHYSLDLAHQSSTDLVNETSRAIEKVFGDTWLGNMGAHWKDMSQKDKDDFGRWLRNTGATAGAVYGGMSAAGQSAGGSGAAGGAGGAGAAGESALAGAAVDGAAGGAAGTAGGGTAAGGVAAGDGAFLGEGVASGVGAWDSAAVAAGGGGGFGSTGIAGAGAGAGAAAGGGAGAAGAGGGGVTSAGGSGGTNWGQLGTTAGSNLLQYYSAQKAAQAQIDAAKDSTAAQLAMYNQTRADYIPWRDGGLFALGKQINLLNDPSQITKDPSYDFELKQGGDVIERSAAQRGGLFSGATLKALQRYGQDFAGTKLDQKLNRYASLSGTGQVATNSITGAGQNYVNNASSNILGAGNARGAGYITGGNALGNMLNQGYSGWKNSQQPQQQPWGYTANSGVYTPQAQNAFNYNQYGTNANGIVIDGY